VGAAAVDAVEAALAATAAGAPVLATLLSAAKEEEAMSSSWRWQLRAALLK